MSSADMTCSLSLSLSLSIIHSIYCRRSINSFDVDRAYEDSSGGAASAAVYWLLKYRTMLALAFFVQVTMLL